MIRRSIAAAALLIAVGCASQIMKSYIGKDIREVVLDRGPPINAMDMGDGRRAFQWVIGSSYTMPATATTTGTANTVGSTTWVNTNTTITGGQTINSQCIYTLFATWDAEREAWRVVDFKKPNIMCE